MTRSWLPTEFRTGSRTEQKAADPTARFVLLARANLVFERVWPRLWPSSGIAGLFLAAGLFDALVALPWTLHALILSGAITAVGLCLYQAFAGTALPGWNDAARKVERDSGFLHRPISEGNDRLLAGAGDATAETLWQMHLAQRLGPKGPMRLALPRLREAWRARDP